ncbi:MAG: lysophospholipid acyltransferase family protein [Reichenbachiella sp.]
MIYVATMFLVTFLLNTPVFLIAILTKSDRLGLIANHYWAHAFFFLVGVPMEIIQKGDLDKKGTYIFCPNHFSFLDIAITPFVPVPFKFVGKVSIAKVPILGFIFRKLHITVDRTRLRDKYATYTKSISALMDGFSLTIFPEGGIRSSNPPLMGSFKEGPFRMAIETGVKIVPITLADNWHIFPDDGRYFFKRRKCRVVIHEPIDPANYSMSRLKDFQEDVRQLIQKELNHLNAIL